MVRQYLLLCGALAVLASCTPLPDHISFSPPDETATVQDVYVSAARLPSIRDADIRQDRNRTARFARYGVSIPPTHATGQIEWPEKDAHVDPATDFAVVDLDVLRGGSAFVERLNAEPGEEVAVFVHGYNNTPSEALYRLAQISHDFSIAAPRVLFAWPSAGTPAGYVYDRDSVLFSRDPLVDLLSTLGRQTDKKIILMAHSMGAQLAMEALRQLALTGRRDVLRKLDAVVLLAPDIDPDIFRAQANVIGRLPDPFVIMTNRHDKALRLSAFLNIGRQKVGDLSRASDVAGLNVTLFDFSAVADGANHDHLVPVTSPAAVALLRNLVDSDRRGAPDLSSFDVGVDGVIRARAVQKAK